MSEEQLIPTPSLFGETGNFLLEREMGRGGMGGVYLGRDKMLDRPVAVKVMLKEYGDDAEFVEKFKREAQAAARLIHPNIAQIYTYGIANGMPYIAMELVAGGSLDRLMQNSGASIDITRVMKIGEQVAQALRCAADQGLVHGDVKPENILLDANGNAKLVDFGLAAMQKNTNEIWGTPYYIAPEKVKKEAVDFRADMYSLGGTLYHALTGVAPFEGDDAAAVVRKRFEGAPVPPSQVRPGISPQIDALILKMLALDPAERYPSFEALLEDFKRIMTYGLTAGGTGRMPTGALPSGHKIGLKGRKRFKMKTSTTKLGSTGELSDFSEDGEGGEGESGGTGGSGVKRHPTMTAAAKDTPDEEGGSARRDRHHRRRDRPRRGSARVVRDSGPQRACRREAGADRPPARPRAHLDLRDAQERREVPRRDIRNGAQGRSGLRQDDGEPEEGAVRESGRVAARVHQAAAVGRAPRGDRSHERRREGRGLRHERGCRRRGSRRRSGRGPGRAHRGPEVPSAERRRGRSRLS